MSNHVATPTKTQQFEIYAHHDLALMALSCAAQAALRARTPDAVYQAVGNEMQVLGYHTVIFQLDKGRGQLAPNRLSFAPAPIEKAAKVASLSVQEFRNRVSSETAVGRAFSYAQKKVCLSPPCDLAIARASAQWKLGQDSFGSSTGNEHGSPS